MKNLLFTLIGVCTAALFFSLFYHSSVTETSAQKNPNLRWEYCAVTTTYIVSNTENQAVINGGANICYLQNSGCLNEEVKSEVIYAGFLQSFKLENTENSKNLAYNRARDAAFSKAIFKLGAEGWEIVNSPSREFDDYILNTQGTFNVSTGFKDTKPDVYFKRLKP